jgi:hypothetical protein
MTIVLSEMSRRLAGTASRDPACQTPARARRSDSVSARCRRRVVLLTTVASVLLGACGTAAAQADFGFLPGAAGFNGSITNEDGSPDTQAGSHPYQLTVGIGFNSHYDSNLGETLPEGGGVRDVTVNLPAGMIVDPTATETTCTEAQLESDSTPGGGCPGSSAVGVATVDVGDFLGEQESTIYNMVRPAGAPAAFGFDAAGAGVFVHLLGAVRTGSDYGLSANSSDILAKLPIIAISTTLWGNPSDPSHDAQRCLRGGSSCKPETERINRPLLTMPSACSGALQTTISADSWQTPGSYVTDSFQTHDSSGSPVGVSGCGLLSFSPSISVRPDTTVADSPSGLAVDLHVPQAGLQATSGLAAANLETTVVTLPRGVSVSPSAADGLAGCSEAQISLSDGSEPACPAASKIGSVEVDTPLLPDPLKGGVYIAQQGNLPDNGSNPFSSLLAIYVTAEADGALIKLAGQVVADPVTGQLTTTFDNNPQLPFTDFKLEFFGGARAALVTPERCGQYTTETQLTPWSGTPPASPSSSFEITSAPDGAPCSALGFSPSFSAGTTDNQAGAFSSFTTTISRTDQDQDLSGITIQTPPGLLGLLSSVPLCGEPEAAAGTCSAASEIGYTTVAAGPGTDPLSLPVAGEPPNPVYLTGPYRGAPFGLSVVVPAIAGPYDLGTVVVRAAINVDPYTTQVTITSDPLPTILQGIPLQVKTIEVTVDRSRFMLNPTNCEVSKVNGTIASAQGTTAAVSSPFQAANCANLPFGPHLSASVAGHASKADGTSFDVKLESAGIGQANIHKVDLQLPQALPSRLSTLQKACLAATFESNPASCGPESVIGKATIHTPLLNSALSGPAYLVSHGGAAFPDIEFVLQGEGVTLVLDGKTEIKNGITYSKFETTPDAPFTSFETELPAGPHSILGAYVKNTPYDLCGANLAMPTEITGQNGAVIRRTTTITTEGGCPPVVSITKTAVKGSALRVTVNLAVGGTVKITGKGLKTTAKHDVKAGTRTITVPLTNVGKAATRQKRKLKIEATLTAGAHADTVTATVEA